MCDVHTNWRTHFRAKSQKFASVESHKVNVNGIYEYSFAIFSFLSFHSFVYVLFGRAGDTKEVESSRLKTLEHKTTDSLSFSLNFQL